MSDLLTKAQRENLMTEARLRAKESELKTAKEDIQRGKDAIRDMEYSAGIARLQLTKQSKLISAMEQANEHDRLELEKVKELSA